MINVAILGFGVVGSGVAEVLTQNKGIIEKKLGSDFINQMDEYGRSMLNIMNK